MVIRVSQLPLQYKYLIIGDKEMKASKKMVSALLSVTSNEILVNLITDILRVEETNSWRTPVIQELLEETRRFYEPEDIDIDIATKLLKESNILKDRVLVDGSVKVSRVLNTINEITIDYKATDADWTQQYNISIDDYLKAKENA